MIQVNMAFHMIYSRMHIFVQWDSLLSAMERIARAIFSAIYGKNMGSGHDSSAHILSLSTDPILDTTQLNFIRVMVFYCCEIYSTYLDPFFLDSMHKKVGRCGVASSTATKEFIWHIFIYGTEPLCQEKVATIFLNPQNRVNYCHIPFAFYILNRKDESL